MKHTLFLLFFCLATAAGAHTVLSPDGRIALILTVDTKGQPRYRCTVDGRPFLLDAPMGLTAREADFASGLKIVKTDTATIDERYTMPWGENKQLRDHCRQLRATLRGKRGATLTITLRAYDDGVAWRYDCDAPHADSLRITGERTQFRLAHDGTAWTIPASAESYEYLYRTTRISAVETANTPATFRMEGPLYAAIHEAALTDFPEMTLRRQGDALQSELAPWPDGVKARYKGGHCTAPWRTVQIGRQAVDLINSSLTLNLNPPCAIDGDLTWIRPMKYVGVWWGMHLGVESWVMGDRHGATTENAIKYIDFAAANNIQGVLFEGWNEGWDSWGGRQNFDFTKPYADFDLDSIMRHARHKGIAVIGHHETGGNVPNYERQLEHAMQWTAGKGIAQVKTGYAGGLPQGLNHHGQYNVRHYRHVVQVAAQNHIAINAHEPIKDTGERRTWPNMLSREGARGMEWNAWSEGNPPEHTCLLPFTRLLAGPMDYTPGTFDILYENTRHRPERKKWNDNDKGNSRVNTTLCKQMANWVVIYSPVQMASDMVENYRAHPCFQFFRDFDADCDWSRALQGEPGEFIAVVRRAKDRFFLGCTTNEQPRTLQIPLTFLDQNTRYRAVIYADAPDVDWKTNPTAYVISEREVGADDTLTVKMAAGGGQAVAFIPARW